ncbi:MAG TPA: MFS transporter [Candidatus Acidoferrales bacterium]|nr:MFS transporter [Candidatus Acidoferrales bacterium]
MAGTSQALTISDVIDQRSMSRFQIWTVVLCGVVLTLDGYDAQTVGFLVPSISQSTGIPVHSFGQILSSSLLGLMLAAMATGPIADRWGRKWPIVISALSFAAFSLLTARATTYNQLLVYRFLTGLGLGGVMPNVVALASEYIPKRLLSAVVTVLFMGMPLGGTICGLLSSAMIRTWGWRWVFYIGGAVPLVIALFLILMLPESVQFLVVRGKDPQKVREILSHIAPQLAAEGVTFRPASRDALRKGVPVKHLFTEGRAAGTILLWIPNFMNLLILYFINGWLPALLKESGMSASAGATATAFISFGGIFACLFEGTLMDLYGAYRILLIEFGFATLFLGALAFVSRSFPLALAVTFATGFLVIGAQSGMNALAAKFYPTSIRSTGVGWALGVGRIGSIVGPLLGGMLLTIGWKPREILLSGALSAVFAWIAIALSKSVRKNATAYTRDDLSKRTPLEEEVRV